MTTHRHPKTPDWIAEALGDFDPVTAMVRIAKRAEHEGDLALAGRMATELAGFVAPKLRALEMSAPEGQLVAISVITGVPSSIEERAARLSIGVPVNALLDPAG